ncbi:cAMP-binding domain of CRP or a regulatory subunit of cAMP-dependent protein kinases [Aquiflexum balticum DSM 16537]|uniref:cAMP-binding domain of CRP or a regulatory subunit of cAMP-dependent protein kinases n=1 Tax=Aquiflexum balticum DSM 16537 TaxID=758820 RepID=A0A1W2H6H2_9BACT|nr:Crp/Fnr family transcriptional regulator [Aquiflexum balticum]SMD44449.1 cAMP-binding domain of CRP or a regulatory subunit of cAMP-dependent protein kinases [Aquiflexum balticum DSM 16537]
MDIYKRRLQIKQYALKHSLFFNDLFYGILENTRVLSYNPFDLIGFHDDNDFLYFLNDGLVMATLEQNPDSDWYRIIYEPSPFGDISRYFLLDNNQLSWYAISQVSLLAIPFNKLMEFFKSYPQEANLLKSHLIQLEIERINLLNKLSKMNTSEKLRFLEVNHPELIIRTKYIFLAKYLGISRSSLSKTIQQISHLPFKE